MAVSFSIQAPFAEYFLSGVKIERDGSLKSRFAMMCFSAAVSLAGLLYSLHFRFVRIRSVGTKVAAVAKLLVQ